MVNDTAGRVRRLLQPTFDEAGWEQEVSALPRPEAVAILAGIMTDSQEPLPWRRQAAFILGLLGDKQAMEPLLAMVDETDRLLRGRVARSLGQIGAATDVVVDRLIARLEDGDYFVRESAAKALGQLRRPEALVALSRMRDTDAVVTNREVAQGAIEAIQGGR